MSVGLRGARSGAEVGRAVPGANDSSAAGRDGDQFSKNDYPELLAL
jgi:hypothetical protein